MNEEFMRITIIFLNYILQLQIQQVEPGYFTSRGNGKQRDTSVELLAFQCQTNKLNDTRICENHLNQKDYFDRHGLQ